MKTCIVGAGAIGGFLGARLASAGVPTSALARGATLAALQAHGWRLDSADASLHARAPVATASDRADALGVHELVILAVKAQALPALAPQLAPLIGPDTVVLTMMNGVPWWFCADQPQVPQGRLESVDPGGVIAQALPVGQVLGGVVHASAATPEPGRVQHRMGRGLIVGEPSGGPSARAEAVGALLRQAGFDTTVSGNLRRELWYKLWGNLTMNPVSAITGATIDQVLADPLVRGFCSQAMQEAALIGERIGCPVDQGPEERHAVTARLGAFRTSMLQDVEAGRPIELDAIVGAVREIGGHVGVATPAIDALLGLTRLFARQRSLYPAAT
ncbi:MAG: 2-dehydropantoate 2-reductase [Pseudomonadota bacterium]|nr:2-dehydropantoate 2-reductase [Pseudomonadota bacterium]